MSSPERRPSFGLVRPPTPGLQSTNPTAPFYQPYDSWEDRYSSPRLTSLDLTSTRDTRDAYESWTELREVPYVTFPKSLFPASDATNSRRPEDDASDSRKLLEPRARRSPSSSTASSASTIVQQSWAVRWLNSIGNGIEAFWRLPGIRHILRLLQWFDGAINRLMARTRFRGWRMGIILGCCMSTIVLGINIAVLIIGATTGNGFENGFAVPMSGLAEEISWWSSAIHIAVNALSTLLLAASNYTMQVLSSPTRKDVDKAHAKNEHLDIGVLSTRNLSRIPRRRLVLFLLMGLSSIPIHLL